MSLTIDLKDKKIKIDDSVLDLMISYRQLNKVDCEAGGIIIGRENKETGNIIIEYATEPYKRDRRTKAFFHRKDRKHLEIFNKLYTQHNNIYAYIGEWHTHPEDYPNYSGIDINNWNNISKQNEDKNKIYYHIIVGNREIRIWEYRRSFNKKANRVY